MILWLAPGGNSLTFTHIRYLQFPRWSNLIHQTREPQLMSTMNSRIVRCMCHNLVEKRPRLVQTRSRGPQVMCAIKTQDAESLDLELAQSRHPQVMCAIRAREALLLCRKLLQIVAQGHLCSRVLRSSLVAWWRNQTPHQVPQSRDPQLTCTIKTGGTYRLCSNLVQLGAQGLLSRSKLQNRIPDPLQSCAQ